MQPKIIIDTDAGHDDALAMMLLIKSQLFDIQAITTVAGNSSIENVTRNAQAVLNLVGANLPVYSGNEKPLERQLITAVVHGDSGLDGLDMSKTQYTLTNDAPDKIIELVKANPGEISLLTLGPLSNVARALQKDPNIADDIKEIIIMGGAIDVPGNKNRVAEFNMFVDPEAADIVFRTDIKKIVVPLDPCNHIILGLDTFEKLAGTSLYEPLSSLMRHFIAGITFDEGVKGALVYDALAAYYLVKPEAFTLKPMNIVIETKGEHTSGMTVAEKRLNKVTGFNAQVATRIDQEQFTTDLLDALAR
ncbi:MAG TPA: nucleoside hydrolase [Candidatus Saccharimonadales bacterium]|nr:nucleoside hydrolase [Candidatus Saccharimonadales bacterium]